MIEPYTALALMEGAADPAVLLTLVAPLMAGMAGIAGAYLTSRVQARQAEAQQTTAAVAREKVIGDLLDSRTREWQAMLAAVTADNATLRAEVATLRAENAEVRAIHARDMTLVTGQNEECQRLTRALIVRIEELTLHG